MKFVLITNLKEKLTYHKSNLQVVASVTLFRNLYKQTHMLFSNILRMPALIYSLLDIKF